MLSGVNVALGVTGSIAAVKVVELAHELRRRGANVRGVMSPSATNIIHPWAVEFATNEPVVTEITGAVEHVELCGYDGWADVLVIAPTTANTLGKIASAVDDTPVTTCATTALGAKLPVVVAPAMHEPMYHHPGVLEAIERLEKWDVKFVAPRHEEGKAKIASEETIALEVARATLPQPLADKRVVVTSGATSEPIDPVRVLTNRASGRTGRAVARACYVRGADVNLVHDGPAVPYANVRHVETGEDMLEAVLDDLGEWPTDALVSAAAISDYTIEQSNEKIRSGQDLSLEFEPTPKLIDEVRLAHPDLPIVGFKAETNGDDEAMIAASRDILERTDLAFVVANDASVMGSEETRTLFVREHTTEEHCGTKEVVADAIADELADVLAREA